MKLLGVYAHPDDETFCTGGTFARYAAMGSEIMVVSATRGQAGQIRSGDAATRRTLARVREAELRLACERLGVAHVECWGYQDGTLDEVDQIGLQERITRVIRSFQPDIVFTFGDEGAYGHPDHITMSRATTAACARSGDERHFPEHRVEGLRPHLPPRLYHAVFPHHRLSLQDRLVRWLIEEGPTFKGDPEFVHGLLLLVEEASSLHTMEDHFEIKWFPAGFSIIEQGEPATTLFLLLSGRVDVVREDAQGTRRFVTQLEPGQFFGEQGIASGLPRNAHVIAAESATCLVFSPSQPTLFEGRGEGARHAGAGNMEGTDIDIDLVGATTRIDAGEFLQTKLRAIAAYRSQFPFRPDMLPEGIFRDLFGAEYYSRILPPRSIETELDTVG
jgi:LmbE family N-acetylglucosaminyl deacetylase